jgi:lysozyme
MIKAMLIALMSAHPVGELVKASPTAVGLIKKYEGFRAKAYMDSNGWAVGYGQTGPNITKDSVVTEPEAVKLLANHIASIQDRMADMIKVPITQNQFDALVSFTYNVGLGKFKSSTLLKLLNQGKHQEAADQLLRWTNKGLKGLVRRRTEERELFLKP